MKNIKKFTKSLESHAIRKKYLYDGFNSSNNNLKDPFKVMTLLIEEVGEVSSALTRGRLSSAKDECIDVAHCAMLLYNCIDNIK
jgi:NTP pyrophosphatase (non-canonical NTP hydrolase)